MKSNFLSIIVLLINILFASHLFAGDAEKFNEIYNDGVSKIQDGLSENVTEANQSYLNSLNGLLKKTRRSGDLDKSIIVTDEIERFESLRSINLNSFDFRAIAVLHARYKKSVQQYELSAAKKIVTLVNRYDQALSEIQKQMVVANEISAAVEIKDIREETQGSSVVKGAKLKVRAAASERELAKRKPVKKAAVVKVEADKVIDSKKYRINNFWMNGHVLVPSEDDEERVAILLKRKKSSKNYWLVEYLEGGEVRIRTYRKPYRYLCIENEKLKLTDDPKEQGSETAKWKFVDYESYIKIRNSKYEEMFIHTEHRTLQVSEVKDSWHSARWILSD